MKFFACPLAIKLVLCLDLESSIFRAEPLLEERNVNLYFRLHRSLGVKLSKFSVVRCSGTSAQQPSILMPNAGLQ